MGFTGPAAVPAAEERAAGPPNHPGMDTPPVTSATTPADTSAGPPGEFKRQAYQVILLLGLVSLLGDITYEGARSITGPYLSVLGASAAAVGLVAGAGEFAGYGLRLLSGYLADRTARYWTLTIIGYAMLLAIPLLALAGRWEVAAGFLVLERLGKAVRAPARDAILSHASKEVGRGWGFGIHEALDQVGALLGPVLFSAVLLLGGGYRVAFSLLWVPAVLVLVMLAVARARVPAPETLEAGAAGARAGASGAEGRSGARGADMGAAGTARERRLPRVFWYYALFSVLAAAGLASFPLVAYHWRAQAVVPEAHIPLLYALAMGVDALVALAVGKAYDRVGLAALVAVPVLTVPVPFLAFSRAYGLAVAAAVLWGAVMAVHETVMRAGIADLTPPERRGLAYGIFNAAYGGALLLGAVAMGFLYEVSLAGLIGFAVALELASLPLLVLVGRAAAGPAGGGGSVAGGVSAL